MKLSKLLFLALLLCASSFAASPWTAYQNGVNGVTVRADSDTQIYAEFPKTTSFHYVADTTLGGRLRRSDTITASGTFNFWMESGWDSDFRLGHFESQGGSLAATYFVGLRFMSPFGGSPGTMRVYPSISYQGSVLLGTALSLETNINWGFGYTWTPTGGDYGYGQLSLTVTNGSTLAVQTTSLSPVNYTEGFQANAFGLVQGYIASSDTEVVKCTVTNPVYTSISTPPALPANMRVFVLVGQSNAHGNNGAETNYLPANTYESTNTFIFTDSEWGYARVNANIHNDIGPEISFLSAVAAKLGVPVGIVKVTKGGTPLTQFIPAAAAMYPLVTNAAITALAQLTTPNLVGVLSVQGESDAASSVDSAAYAANFATLMTALRTDLSRPSLTNIVSRLHNTGGFNTANLAVIRAAQEALIHYVNTDDLTLIDTIHFDTDSQLELGWRMANEYFEILNGATPAYVGNAQTILIVANAAALVASPPAGRQVAFLKDGGGLFVYDSDSLYPTNTTYCFKPASTDGRWLHISTIPGVSAARARSIANLDDGLALGYKTTTALAVGTTLTLGNSPVLTVSSVNASAELRALFDSESGVGDPVFNSGPTITNLNIAGELQLPYTTSSPGLNEIGEVAAWQNFYGVGRGGIIGHDGTEEKIIISLPTTDAPYSAGDLIQFNGTKWVKLPKGTSGYVLTAGLLIHGLHRAQAPAT
jgi:hypothetical protein